MQKVARKACFVAKYCSQCGLHGPQPHDTSASSNSVWRLLDFSSDMISFPFSVAEISCSFPFGIEPLLLCCFPQISPFPFAIFGGIIVNASTFPFARIWVSSPAIVYHDDRSTLPRFTRLSSSFSTFCPLLTASSRSLARILPRWRTPTTVQTIFIRTVNLHSQKKKSFISLRYIFFHA